MSVSLFVTKVCVLYVVLVYRKDRFTFTSNALFLLSLLHYFLSIYIIIVSIFFCLVYHVYWLFKVPTNGEWTDRIRVFILLYVSVLRIPNDFIIKIFGTKTNLR